MQEDTGRDVLRINCRISVNSCPRYMENSSIVSWPRARVYRLSTTAHNTTEVAARERLKACSAVRTRTFAFNTPTWPSALYYPKTVSRRSPPTLPKVSSDKNRKNTKKETEIVKRNSSRGLETCFAWNSCKFYITVAALIRQIGQFGKRWSII